MSTSIEVGYWERDITPEPGLELTGYGYWLDRRATETLDPLMVRALVFTDGSGNRAAVLQYDLLALDVDFTTRVRRRIHDSLGIRPQAALLHCTHTHNGPAVRPLFGCGMPDARFVKQLEDVSVWTVERAAEHMVDVRSIRWFETPFPDGFAYNRTGGAVLDEHIRGVLLETPGTPVCMVSYSCHPVTLGRCALYSADYCGAVVRELNAYGFRALYINGSSGDVNPLVRRVFPDAGTAETLRTYGRDLGTAFRSAMRRATPVPAREIRAASTRPELDLDLPAPDTLRRIIDEKRANAAENPGDFRARVAALWAESLLERLQNDTLDDVTTAEIQVLDFGGFTLAGFAAETFTALGLRLREALAPRRIITAGTCNGVIGYISDRRDVEHGGYAASDACRIYGMPHPRPGAGEKWVDDAVREILPALLRR